MYGIMTGDGNLVLCRFDTTGYILRRWDRNGILVMRESAIEIDQLMQDFMVAACRYDLCVFKFTEEQEQQQLIRKLTGR